MLLGLDDSIKLKDHVKKLSIHQDILSIAWVLDKPVRLPVELETIHNIAKDNNIHVRLALARAQIDAALNMNENLQKYTKQKFVAETMERVIFGDLLLEGKFSKNSSSNGNGNTKKTTAKKTKAKPGSAKKNKSKAGTSKKGKVKPGSGKKSNAGSGSKKKKKSATISAIETRKTSSEPGKRS